MTESLPGRVSGRADDRRVAVINPTGEDTAGSDVTAGNPVGANAQGSRAARPLQRAVELVFAVVARWRRGRALHTRGVVLDALLVLDPHSCTGSALGGPGERPAVVRMSKSVSLPGRRAELLGIGLRIPAGDRNVLDVLLASVGRHDLDHVLLMPSSGWWDRPYNTLLPYLVDGRLLALGLTPPVAPPARTRPR